MSEEAVTFKAYLVQEGLPVEVRHFMVETNVATSFMYLKEKIHVVFPYYKSPPPHYAWKEF